MRDSKAIDFSDPPPAYSSPTHSPRSSVSEVSILETASQFDDYDDYDADEPGEKDAEAPHRTEPSPYALAFVERFRRPSGQVQLISQTRAEAVEQSPTDRGKVTLDIVVMIVGENVDPFITLSKRLVNDSHRVRVAAHAKYGALISQDGFEFWPIDKSRMNSGTFETCLSNLTRQRPSADQHQARRILFGNYVRCWEACITPFAHDPRPFVADAIIASPLAYASIHCADRLSIPLHIMSSIPCSPTEKYAHPASLPMVETDEEGLSNLLSYAMVEESVWKTIIDPINHFRQHVLGLKRIHPSVAGRLVQDQAIPHTYFCSDMLVKRPMDWLDTLQMSGYPLDDDDQAKYNPTKALKNVLHSSERLVYFMIAPQTLDDPSQFVRDLSASGETQGLCILFPSAWQNSIDPGMFRNVFLTDGAPDAWIVSQVNVIVHTANIRSTALALRYGKPSVMTPFDREQTSRAHTIAKAEAGLSLKILTPASLAIAIKSCLDSHIQEQASRLGRKAESETSGLENATQSFYRWFTPPQCSITEHDLATYTIIKKPGIRTSAAVAAVLLREQLVKQSELEQIRHQVYDIVGEGVVRAGVKSTKVYLDAFANAAHDIATSSDLVGMIHRRAQSNHGNKKRNVANGFGVGTAKFFGNVALLPFTTTALMVNTVTVGIKTAKSVSRHQSDDDYGARLSSISQFSFKSYNNDDEDGDSQSSATSTKKENSRGKQLAQLIALKRSERGFQDPRVYEREFQQMVVDRFKRII